MSPATTRLITLLSMLLGALLAVAALLFWQSFASWQKDSPLINGAKEGWGWTAQQYLVELANSEAELARFVAGQSLAAEAMDRLAILSSRGAIYSENSPLARNIKDTDWAAKTSARLATAADDAYQYAEVNGMTIGTANVLAERLGAVKPLATEFNVRMRLRDMQEMSQMAKQQTRLQGALVSAVLAAFIVCGVLIGCMWRVVKVSVRNASLADQQTKLAEEQAERAKSQERLSARINEEWITYFKLRTDNYQMKPEPFDVIEAATEATGHIPLDVSARLPGLLVCADRYAFKLAVRVLASIASYRGGAAVHAHRDEKTLYVEISDTGNLIEVPIQKLCRLGEESRAAGDIGIGFELAYLLAKLNGGDLSLSAEKSTNTFTLAVPIHHD